VDPEPPSFVNPLKNPLILLLPASEVELDPLVTESDPEFFSCDARRSLDQ
jgi:hypothetical protein